MTRTFITVLALAACRESSTDSSVPGSWSERGPRLAWTVPIEGSGRFDIAPAAEGGVVVSGTYQHRVVIAGGTADENSLEGDGLYTRIFLAKLRGDGSVQ